MLRLLLWPWVNVPPPPACLIAIVLAMILRSCTGALVQTRRAIGLAEESSRARRPASPITPLP
jgi:hypothetical protein